MGGYIEKGLLFLWVHVCLLTRYVEIGVKQKHIESASLDWQIDWLIAWLNNHILIAYHVPGCGQDPAETISKTDNQEEDLHQKFMDKHSSDQ